MRMKLKYFLSLGGRGARHLAAFCAIMLGFVSQHSQAVIIYGSGDPAANSSSPDGVLVNSGWQYEGQWGGFLGTPIAPQYFVAARHVGGCVGQTFTFNGLPYVTTAYFDDTNSDLRIWKVDGTFSSYAPLYSFSDELGKPMVVIGRGTQRGDSIIVSLVQTNYTTNTYDLKSLGVSRKQAQNMYPNATFRGSTMIMVTSDVVTNDMLKGWKTGAGDGVMRWGESKVIAADSFIVGAFNSNLGPNSCYLSGGDSSGAVFIQNATGVWCLAGINYGIDGPFGVTPTESFYAALFDESGLYNGSILIPNDGQVRPAAFYCSRISARLDWIQNVISQ